MPYTFLCPPAALTVQAQLLGQQIGQILTISLEAFIAVQLLAASRPFYHYVGCLQYRGHYVGAILLEFHMRTQTHVFCIQRLQARVVVPLGDLYLRSERNIWEKYIDRWK